MKQLKNNLYYIGALNPNLRVFDIIMTTEFGTSYNSYLIKDEKTAIIETVHDKFSKIFFDSISEICDVSEIDYVILNHTEPDHSGSLVKLLEKNPEITVVGTVAAIKNLKNITNRDFNSLAVKAGDTLCLGSRTLEFIPSPNIHWPDTMLTYIGNEKLLFSCDFLGSHYCEPTITDEWISSPEAYNKSFLSYYTAIMSPFKPFVLSALEKLKGLDIQMVCPSHGPVLMEGIEKAINNYKQWSLPSADEKLAPVFYVSAYGYTEMMAKALAKGLESKGYNAPCYDIIKCDMSLLTQQIHKANILLFGSPTINRDAVKPIWDLISTIDPVSNKGKSCFVFGSYGWSGEGCKNLVDRLQGIGLKVAGTERVVFKPTDDDIKRLEQMGADLV